MSPPTPLPVPIDEIDGSVFDGGCMIVGYPDLACGLAPANQVPTLVLVEETEVSGQRDPEFVEYDIAPKRARIRYPGGEVILNFEARAVAFFDSESAAWSVESLESWRSHVDSITAQARAHLWPRSPRFESSGESILVVGQSCLQHTLVVGAETAAGETETIEQQIWVTRTMQATQEIYATYRHALRLVDRQWLDVPVDRPPGFILRTRVVRRPAGAAPGDADLVQDAIVRQADYKLMPREFFDIPAGDVALPVAPSGSQ